MDTRTMRGARYLQDAQAYGASSSDCGGATEKVVIAPYMSRNLEQSDACESFTVSRLGSCKFENLVKT